MSYVQRALPFQAREVEHDSWVAVSSAGDFVFLSPDELQLLREEPAALPLVKQAELQAKHFLRSVSSPAGGLDRLLRSRQLAKRETTVGGPTLHIIVPTLQCAHTCRYCQVSRSLDDTGFSLATKDLDDICETIFQSSAEKLTIEFQGGDPLLRFDLVKYGIQQISRLAEEGGKKVRIVVASTLHQLDDDMCGFFKDHGVFLSTSIDGPSWLHNKNRPLPMRDSYERTVAGITLARDRLGNEAVAALMTATAESLKHPHEIVDEYVRLGFGEIFLRPLSLYGFAKRNQALLGYGVDRYQEFYERALDRVEFWADQGVEMREVYASIVLNKLLSTFDSGYVDLQSPTVAGQAVLVYNYDRFVYPSDEARMLAESGDTSLRMGRIDEPLPTLLGSPVRLQLAQSGDASLNASCSRCAYQTFCSPNPVDAQAQLGRMSADAADTEHCARNIALFDFWLRRLRSASPERLDRYHTWAECGGSRER